MDMSSNRFDSNVSNSAALPSQLGTRHPLQMAFNWPNPETVRVNGAILFPVPSIWTFLCQISVLFALRGKLQNKSPFGPGLEELNVIDDAKTKGAC